MINSYVINSKKINNPKIYNADLKRNDSFNQTINNIIKKGSKSQLDKRIIKKTAIYYEKQQTVEYTLMILNLISIFLAYSLFDNLHSKLENQVNYDCEEIGFLNLEKCSFNLKINGNSEIFKESEFSLNIILITSSFLSIFMILWNIFYSIYKIKYLRYKGKISYSSNLLNTKEYKILIINISTSIIHPNYYLKFYSFLIIKNKIHARYFLNDILCLLILVRVISFITLIISNISYNSLKAERICEINGFKKGLFFGIKCLMKLNPFKLIFISFLIIVFIFSFGIRVCEYSYAKADNQESFTSYFICIWWVIITMTTVGYGDYFPITVFGRSFALIVCILGVFIISTSVIALHNTINLSNKENNVI